MNGDDETATVEDTDIDEVADTDDLGDNPGFGRTSPGDADPGDGAPGPDR